MIYILLKNVTLIIKIHIMTFIKLLSLIILFSILLFLSACQHDTPEFENFPEMSFSQDVLPVFQTGCAINGCHDQNTAKENRVYDSYQNIIRDIDPGNPKASKTYQIMFDPVQPMPPKTVIPQSDRTKIRLWILQGAKDN
jgi:hypothetical protein